MFPLYATPFILALTPSNNETFHKAFATYFHAGPKQVPLSHPTVGTLKQQGKEGL